MIWLNLFAICQTAVVVREHLILLNLCGWLKVAWPGLAWLGGGDAPDSLSIPASCSGPAAHPSVTWEINGAFTTHLSTWQPLYNA